MTDDQATRRPIRVILDASAIVATVVIADESADWRALATTYDIVGRSDAASAVLAAIDNDCDVLTRQPGLYAGLAGGGPVIPIEE